MRKKYELTDPSSCLNKALSDELVFVLLQRDAAAPATIRFWVQERIRLGKNKPTDIQILCALSEAMSMEEENRLKEKFQIDRRAS